jgi:hypothetical protein
MKTFHLDVSDNGQSILKDSKQVVFIKNVIIPLYIRVNLFFGLDSNTSGRLERVIYPPLQTS